MDTLTSEGAPWAGYNHHIQATPNNGGFSFDNFGASDWLRVNQENTEMAGRGNVLTRFLQPGAAENAQFARENYFMDKENAFNEYMWNLQNEYNDPSAQMQRFKEAGINPMLAAAGVAGMPNTAAQAAPGASGSSGMNTTGLNPFEALKDTMGAFTQGVEGVNGLGNLFGFGKKNKADIKVAEETANELRTKANLDEAQTKQIQDMLPILMENARKEGRQIEQNIKNLRSLNDVYKEQKKNIAKQTELYGEQVKTQQYQNYELEFKKAFREMFGVQLNDSDISMLAQLMLQGKGDFVIQSLSNTIDKVFQEIDKQTKKMVENREQEIRDFQEGIKDTIKTIANYPRTRTKQWLEEQKQKRHARKERQFRKRIDKEWEEMGEHWMKIGRYKNKEEWIKACYQHRDKDYSGRW